MMMYLPVTIQFSVGKVINNTFLLVAMDCCTVPVAPSLTG